MKTRITELFGIKYPIICGGMLWVTEPTLCAAISQAGGLGCLTADQYNSGEELRAEIRKVRALTDKPMGVNITLMPSFRLTEQTFDDFFRVCAEEKVTNIEVSGRFADKYIPMLHEAGVKITHKVGAVRHAAKIEKLGYDAVIVAGVEEGGHPLKDNVATTVLLPRVAETVNIPILATGGAVDGKSMAALLTLGADGVMMATRFMLSKEAKVHDNIKNWLCSIDETGTVLFCKTTLQARAAKNAATAKVQELENRFMLEQGNLMVQGKEMDPQRQQQLIMDAGDVIAGYRLRKALETGDTDGAAFFIGQSIGRINSVLSCKEILDGMMAQCEDTLKATYAKYIQ